MARTGPTNAPAGLDPYLPLFVPPAVAAGVAERGAGGGAGGGGVAPGWGPLYQPLKFMDRRERKNGGRILVAVTEDDAAKFSKHFGTAPDGMQTRRMRGIFQVTPNTKGTRVWYIDYEGANGKALEDAKDDCWIGAPE